MMSNLKELKVKARSLVDDRFLSSDNIVIGADEDTVEAVSPSLSLDDFHDLIAATMNGFSPFNTQIDGFMASRLHQALPLTPRQAGAIGVWHYLSVVEAPQLVRHRWQAKQNGLISRERFLGNFVRNTFSRLWWGAELTVKDGNDYSLTDVLFSKSQDLYEAVFGRAFSRYPPATHAFLRILGSESEDVFRLLAKNFNHILTTLVLEDLDEGQIEDLLNESLASV
jgi:hypothetical protein